MGAGLGRVNFERQAREATVEQAVQLKRIADALERYLNWMGVPAVVPPPAVEEKPDGEGT
jgi:hypothetical protein